MTKSNKTSSKSNQFTIALLAVCVVTLGVALSVPTVRTKLSALFNSGSVLKYEEKNKMLSPELISQLKTKPSYLMTLNKCGTEKEVKRVVLGEVLQEPLVSQAYSLTEKMLNGAMSEKDYAADFKKIASSHFMISQDGSDVLMQYRTEAPLPATSLVEYSATVLNNAVAPGAQLQGCEQSAKNVIIPENVVDLKLTAVMLFNEAKLSETDYTVNNNAPAGFVVYNFKDRAAMEAVHKAALSHFVMDEVTYTELNMPTQNVRLTDYMRGYITDGVAMELNILAKNSTDSQMYLLKMRKIGKNAQSPISK